MLAVIDLKSGSTATGRKRGCLQRLVNKFKYARTKIRVNHFQINVEYNSRIALILLFSVWRLTMDTQNKQQENQSEIARFLARWDEEMEAIRQGLTGFALTARHDFITQRMQAFGDEKMIELMALEMKKQVQDRASSTDITR